MGTKIESFRQIIELWPSIGEFAADIGVKEGTAKLMRFRDSIHANYWVAVVEAAKARRIKGVSLQTLAALLVEKKIAADGKKAA